MPFDFVSDRGIRGRLAYQSGLSAEQQVASHYERCGIGVIAQRWRGKVGEIDLIAQEGSERIFVEVKKARDFVRAAESLSTRQKQRIMATAAEFIGSESDGALTPCRFDVALVDDAGRIEILENAFGVW